MKTSWSHVLPGIRVEGQPYERAYAWFDDFDIGGFLPNTAGKGGKYDETADAGEFLVTVVDGGTDNAETIVVADNIDGGVTDFTTNDADNDLLNIQRNGERYHLRTRRDLLMEWNLAIGDVDKVDWLVGLCITDTSLLASLPSDGIGFKVAAGDASQEIVAFCRKAGTETTLSTGVSVTDGVFVTMRMEVFDLDRAVVYINGAPKGEIVTNLPTEHLTESWTHRNVGGQATTLRLARAFVVMDP